MNNIYHLCIFDGNEIRNMMSLAVSDCRTAAAALAAGRTLDGQRAAGRACDRLSAYGLQVQNAVKIMTRNLAARGQTWPGIAAGETLVKAAAAAQEAALALAQAPEAKAAAELFKTVDALATKSAEFFTGYAEFMA